MHTHMYTHIYTCTHTHTHTHTPLIHPIIHYTCACMHITCNSIHPPSHAYQCNIYTSHTYRNRLEKKVLRPKGVAHHMTTVTHASSFMFILTSWFHRTIRTFTPSRHSLSCNIKQHTGHDLAQAIKIYHMVYTASKFSPGTRNHGDKRSNQWPHMEPSPMETQAVNTRKVTHYQVIMSSEC